MRQRKTEENVSVNHTLFGVHDGDGFEVLIELADVATVLQSLVGEVGAGAGRSVAAGARRGARGGPGARGTCSRGGRN